MSGNLGELQVQSNPKLFKPVTDAVPSEVCSREECSHDPILAFRGDVHAGQLYDRLQVSFEVRETS